MPRARVMTGKAMAPPPSDVAPAIIEPKIIVIDLARAAGGWWGRGYNRGGWVMTLDCKPLAASSNNHGHGVAGYSPARGAGCDDTSAEKNVEVAIHQVSGFAERPYKRNEEKKKKRKSPNQSA